MSNYVLIYIPYWATDHEQVLYQFLSVWPGTRLYHWRILYSLILYAFWILVIEIF